MLDGIILVDKPEGWTSFDVCAKIHNLSQTKKVGHSGTLDPFATGILPVFLGRATKSIQSFLEGDKGYEGEMVLGVKTDTGDKTGKIQTSNLKIQNKFQTPITKFKIEEVLKRYTGEIEQKPPMYSAVKVGGQRLYKLARQGIEVERQARKITIYELRLTDNDSPGATDNRITFYVHCSKGTYIRQLASDIGDELGCGAHLSSLRRVLSRPFHISQALTMDTLINLAKIEKLDTVVLPVGDFITTTQFPQPQGL